MFHFFYFQLYDSLQGVKIRIVQSPPNKAFPSLDTAYLSKNRLADVRSLDIARLVGSGILHTKMWLVDGKHFYVGSANQDWRALTQVWRNLQTRFTLGVIFLDLQMFLDSSILECSDSEVFTLK